MANGPGKQYWRLLALVVDGKSLPVAQGSVLTVEGDRYSFAVHGTVYQKGISIVDESKSPRESDVTITQGKGKGDTILQISKIEDDILIACQGKTGAPRPTRFQSLPGSGDTLSVWIRLSSEEALRATRSLLAQALFIAMVMILAQALDVIKTALAPLLGPIGAVVASGLLCVAAVLAVSHFCKWGWRSGAVNGMALATGLLVYIDLRKVLEPTLSDIGATAAAASTAVMASLIISGLLALIFKPREV
jgi:uncharacterized protein (TIGR03067 family)